MYEAHTLSLSFIKDIIQILRKKTKKITFRLNFFAEDFSWPNRVKKKSRTAA